MPTPKIGRPEPPGPGKGLACIRTLLKIHPTLRDDPFRIMKGALAGVPNHLGYNCASCEQPVRRGFTQPQLTGFAFSFIACGCTGLNQFANLGDPTRAQWSKFVAEADELEPGEIKIDTELIDEPPAAGGPN